MRACEFTEALLAEKSEHLALRYMHHVFEGLFSINWLAAWLFNVSAYRQLSAYLSQPIVGIVEPTGR